MYDPCTLAFSFPPYPKSGVALGRGEKKPWSFGRALYALSPWIGFDIWHVDPERSVPGQRRDDSCGWFPRNLTPELQKAINELSGKGWESERARIQQAMDRWTIPDARYPSLREMPMDVAFATHLMALTLIDRLAFRVGKRWDWQRKPPTATLVQIASDLAFSTVDNLNGATEDQTPERYLRLLAAAYRRRLRPWWKHPRWHVHHWRINVHLARNLKRMFQRCPACGKRLGFGYCPTSYGGVLYHGTCSPDGANTRACAAA